MLIYIIMNKTIKASGRFAKKNEQQNQSYQFVILDCPYDTWSDSFTRDLFGKLVDLKFKGYLMSYPYGTLPVDTSDFVATHLIICKKDQDSLTPIMSYKTISRSRCLKHNITFPALSILQAARAQDHIFHVEKFLARAKEEKREISYDGSWTMTPELRKDKERSEELKVIMRAITVQYHLGYNVPEIIGFGLPRFKTEKFFETIGYEQIKHEGENLPYVLMPSLQNEPVALVHLEKFTDQAVQDAKTHEYLWLNRLEISDPDAAQHLGSTRKAS